MIIFIKLLLAHLIGDFILQPASWVREKTTQKHIAGRWEGIGFLIAAKSVFRFSDIKNNVNNKLTDYFLIGTLLSIGIALFTGLMVLYAQILLSEVK